MLKNRVEKIIGLVKGPIIGIMAITHGDETAGLEAHAYLRNYFKHNKLEKGEIWLMTGNDKANKLSQRCIKHDLNRLFLADNNPFLNNIDKQSYDFKLSRELMPYLEQLDYFFDIHSTTRPSVAFSLCLGSSKPETDLAKGFPVTFYASSFEGYIHGTTIEWVKKHGGVGVAVECGFQDDPQTKEIAISCVKSFLGHLGIKDFARYKMSTQKSLTIVGSRTIIDKDTFDYLKEYKNFDPIKAGELIAKDNKVEYRAPDIENLSLIFPVSIKSVRNGSNTEAYFLGQFN